MEKSNILAVQLARPHFQAPIFTSDDSWLLCAATRYKEDHILAFAERELKKSQELRRLFADLAPDEASEFTIELGVTLPDLLPTLGGEQEYRLSIATDHSVRELCVSNSMRQIAYVDTNDVIFGIFPNHGEADFRVQSNVPVGTPSISLRSTITTRFKIKGIDAEDALEANIDSCLREFIFCLNRLLATLHSADTAAFEHFSLVYDQSTFPWVYLLIRGKESAIHIARIVPHAGRVAFVPKDLKDDRETQVREMLNSPARSLDPRTFLASARVAAQSGLNQLALLQSVIASEIATAQFVKRHLLSKGVANSKWNQYKTDVSYSQMLNFYLFALTSADNKPNAQTIGTLNRARNLRNSLMHEGAEALNRGELSSIIEATTSHLDYLEQHP